jgi:hypothetical protein
MKRFAILLWIGLLARCATEYQPQSFTGGFSDFMTAPDEAVVTFHGNGYTPAERVVEMAALRCAEVTLQHGYRYFVVTKRSGPEWNLILYDAGLCPDDRLCECVPQLRDRQRHHHLPATPDLCVLQARGAASDPDVE